MGNERVVRRQIKNVQEAQRFSGAASCWAPWRLRVHLARHCPHMLTSILFVFNWSIVDLQCCVNSAVQPSDSVIHLYTFFWKSFSMMVYHRILNPVPCAMQSDLLFLCSMCNGSHLLTPNSQSFPPPPLPGQPQVCSLPFLFMRLLQLLFLGILGPQSSILWDLIS